MTVIAQATIAQVRKHYEDQGYEVAIRGDHGAADRHIEFRKPGGEWREGRWLSEYRVTDDGNVHLI